MSEVTKIFKLFACNIPVKGAKRSIICDLQRNEFHFIPNILFFILTNLKDKNIPEIKAYYENKNDIFIDEYFDFLLSNELGFFTDIPESYPEIDLRWEKPSIITNAIIDIDINSNHSFDKLRNQLDNLGCKALQLRFYDSLDFNQLFEILDIFNESRLESIDIIYPFGIETIEEEIKRIVSKYQRISFFIVHSSPEDQLINHEKLKTNILYLKKSIVSWLFLKNF